MFNFYRIWTSTFKQLSYTWYTYCIKDFPRILGGFYLGYIANKYGIKYSILMHCINNTIPFWW
jgi:hypothetical protein